MSRLYLCFLIFLAGGCGALSRFLVSELANKLAGGSYPLGTAVVNVLGSFLFGFIWQVSLGRSALTGIRIIICAGFLGGFTTFSSFIFDSYLLGQSRPSLLLFNLLIQIILGFSGFFGGVHLAKLFV